MMGHGMILYGCTRLTWLGLRLLDGQNNGLSMHDQVAPLGTRDERCRHSYYAHAFCDAITGMELKRRMNGRWILIDVELMCLPDWEHTSTMY